MILIENFSQVAAQIESERGISKEALVIAVEQALVSACRRKFSEEAILEAQLNIETGEATIFQRKTVVAAEPENAFIEISLEDAQKSAPEIAIGEEITLNVTPSDFGRLAAQTAKQVIIQRIREAEKNSIFDEFKSREGCIITGTVQRIEEKSYLINLGRIETSLMPSEQIPGERFDVKEKIKLFLVGAEKNSRGPFIRVSRSHPGFLGKLFELEIPEIQDGTIEFVSISREAGKRSKIAVKSNNPSVGAVGTCVGHMGGRIQSVVKEIGDEKIDILEWHENPRVFIANSLKPAKITDVILVSEQERSAVVVVGKDQLSLAIGKSGINVRLAVRLTGWKLDILSEEEFAERESDIREKAQLSMAEKIKQAAEKLKAETPEIPEVVTPIVIAEPVAEIKIIEPAPEEDPVIVTEIPKPPKPTPKPTPKKAPKKALPVQHPVSDPTAELLLVLDEVDLSGEKIVEGPQKLSQVAKDLNMTVKALSEKATLLGISVKNGSSIVSVEDIGKLKES